MSGRGVWGCGYFSQIMTIFRAELNVFHWVEVMNDGKRRAIGRMLICSGLRADITLKLLFFIILFFFVVFHCFILGSCFYYFYFCERSKNCLRWFDFGIGGLGVDSSGGRTNGCRAQAAP